jgi:FKBP-type peptidyl-prolyl cis-trans isomerase
MAEYESDAAPVQATLSSGELIQTWEQAMKTMYKGECATIIARMNTSGATTGTGTMVAIYELQLIDFY